MSAAEETIRRGEAADTYTKPIGDRALDFISSVRFGVTLLCILVVLSMVGMLIIQQNVQGFDAYYASLTPAEKLVYGYLGFFDIYYAWYFKVLLLILSLNIILASIDRFPSAWAYISKPKLTATRSWLLSQPQNAEIEMSGGDGAATAREVASVFRRHGLKPRVTQFEESGYGVAAGGGKDFGNIIRTSLRC